MKRTFSLILQCFLTCLLLCSLSARADAVMNRIQATIAKPEILCGQFEQKKILVGMKKPLLSSGRFCVTQNKGVVWHAIKPFDSTLRITKNEIVQQAKGNTTMRMSAEKEPVLQTINRIIFSLIAGDFSPLETYFIVKPSITKNNWQVQLSAREDALRKVISKVSVSGDQYVKTIRIDEGNGDKTYIVFSGILTGQAAKTIPEAAMYE
jgi:hypothetical protein